MEKLEAEYIWSYMLENRGRNNWSALLELHKIFFLCLHDYTVHISQSDFSFQMDDHEPNWSSKQNEYAI